MWKLENQSTTSKNFKRNWKNIAGCQNRQTITYWNPFFSQLCFAVSVSHCFASKKILGWWRMANGFNDMPSYIQLEQLVHRTRPLLGHDEPWPIGLDRRPSTTKTTHSEGVGYPGPGWKSLATMWPDAPGDPKKTRFVSKTVLKVLTDTYSTLSCKRQIRNVLPGMGQNKQHPTV